AASRLAPEFGQFGLSSDPALCGPRDRVLPTAGNPATPWVAGDDPLPLGMKEGEGFCYLVRVWGQFDTIADAVEIGLQNGEYVLQGTDATDPSNHGAVAECVRF
ncbi:hypothetical protein, partial [Paracoccus sp. (in: a-proteobacteria)]|uniref:hypothetical protein n=1 Tax=Paracoccus sp. TaxID=267 RepID=UPI0026DF68D8